MPLDVIEFHDQEYLALQSTGFAAQFTFPFAKRLLHGVGYDIGCNRKEWALPESIPIDPLLPGCEYDAFNLPPMAVDFIYSSHCLEHLSDWVGALDYWATKIRTGGILFLYLPHPRQKYWLPFHNRKHIHSLDPKLIQEYLEVRGWKKIVVTGEDLNFSYYAIAEKP